MDHEIAAAIVLGAGAAAVLACEALRAWFGQPSTRSKKDQK